ncbi:hypothetical protein MTO96_004920 [Rhipicephalus appendiculatus]
MCRSARTSNTCPGRAGRADVEPPTSWCWTRRPRHRAAGWGGNTGPGAFLSRTPPQLLAAAPGGRRRDFIGRLRPESRLEPAGSPSAARGPPQPLHHRAASAGVPGVHASVGGAV